ncbi:MAG: cytochrome P450 [Steroidobacteraceae bacterium]|nr:cytochrome P450 [Deltaproteobacteria bacterium]
MAPVSENPVPSGFDRLPVLDLRAPDFINESNRMLKELRAQGPLCRVEPVGYLGMLRWSDCDAVLRDFRSFSAAFPLGRPIPGAEAETTLTTLIREDPPKHTRVRSLVQQAFTPERVKSMEPHILGVARRMIDQIMARGDRCDFVRDFTLPFPSTVLSELLGIDPSMVETFKRWAESTLGQNTAHEIIDEAARQQRFAEIARDAKEFEAYIKVQIEERRRSPGQDMITHLVQAAESGEKLTMEEVLKLTRLFIVAGNHTTTQAMGMTMQLLISHPEQMRILANDLSLTANAFEESLRHLCPFTMVPRKAVQEVEIAGVTIPKGCWVAPILASANHDEAVFENPEVFDIRRKIPRMMAFSAGNHQCIGQSLARMEAQLAFEEWFSRVSSFSSVGEPVPHPALSNRGFDSLPVSFERRATNVVTTVRPIESAVSQVATAEKLAAMTDQQLGLDKRPNMTVKVQWVREASSTVKLFKMIHPTGGLLPRFTPGSHIIIHMRDGDKVYRNSYSLLNAGVGERLTYFIAVQLAANSKGGSKYLHERVERGSELTISVPANYFPPAEHAAKHLLIAGGIGITPLIAHRFYLKQHEEALELHYAFRSGETAAFNDELGFENDPTTHLYDESLGQRLDIPALIRRQPMGTHLYTCGPEGFMDAAIEAAEALGWPEETIHVERFGAGPRKGDLPFEVLCKCSGKTFEVGADEMLIDGLERAGYEIPFACRAGSCGSCETRVLDGEIIHRDSVLTTAEREEGQKIMVCVSRGKGSLTLEI